MKQIWRTAGEALGLDINVTGLPTLAAFSFKSASASALNTQFTIEILKRSFLAFRQFKPSLAHHSVELECYKAAVDEVFALLAADPSASQLDFPHPSRWFSAVNERVAI
ncbi:MAG: hypothetical protein RIQ73_155 [Actinomycetota bacterium]